MIRFILLLTVLSLAAPGCAPKVKLFSGPGDEPLKEFTLQGGGPDKILLLSIRGTISARPNSGLLSERPSMLQEALARLEMAEQDDDVKAVILAIDSPGGTVTASDILYESLARFKTKNNAKVVALLFGLAASGGYYTAAAADKIVAHPTTITGSIGAVFIRPDIKGLMDKIGVDTEITKSGKYKDMSSFFRNSTAEEREMMQTIINQLNARFLSVVQKSRALTDEQLADVANARIMTAGQAVEAGLVDSIGYAEEAVELAAKIAGLKDDPKVIVYRRSAYANDTLYNPIQSTAALRSETLLGVELPAFLQTPQTGFHYLWTPGLE